MSTRSQSPPLPTFGIRDLAGPQNPPGLISISRRQYDSTIKSEPDAKLLYLDDDDGELITVGSSLELSQRLDEPVLNYRSHSINGKLIHIFDIKHSNGSLFQWRDHEAYSSKELRSRSTSELSLSSYRDPVNTYNARLREEMAEPSFHEMCQVQTGASVTATTIEEPEDEWTIPEKVSENQKGKQESATCSDMSTDLSTSDGAGLPEPAQEAKEVSAEGSADRVNILEGLDEHLSGLARVLTLAAATFQKAAEKTRNTDTSVVEDILAGVKDILTEVGSFGIEAFKELSREVDTPSTQEDITQAQEDKDIQGQYLAEELGDEAADVHQETLPDLSPSDSPVSSSTDTETETTATRVKFAFVEDEDEVIESPALGSSPSRPIVVEEDSIADIDMSYQNNNPDKVACKKPINPSILDDSSEDSDFTARYPPLSSVRRARSAIESAVKPRSYVPLQERLFYTPKTEPDQSARTPSIYTKSFAMPHICPQPRSQLNSWEKQEGNEPVLKPLPGAWPDVKNDSKSILPTSAESSGAFFNRMTCRNNPVAPSKSGLHRANTTASSNPASRLNGPFDPGFPYEPSDTTTHRPYVSFRSQRRSASPFRHLSDQVSARLTRAEENKQDHKIAPKRSMPSFARSARCGPINLDRPAATPNRSTESSNTNGFRDFDTQRGVKHHHSVPHFRPYAHPPGLQAPFRAQPQWPQSESAPFALPASQVLPASPDWLTGPAATSIPAPSLAAYPAVLPIPAVPVPPYAPLLKPADQRQQIPRSGLAADNSPISPVPFTMYPTWTFPAQASRDLQPDLRPATAVSSASSANAPRSWSPEPLNNLEQFYDSAPSIEFSRSNPLSKADSFTKSPSSRSLKKSKFDICVEKLQMCGFGIDDDNLKDRLHVYAVAANGDIEDAVEMIEEDRKVSAGRFD
ncbi:hypothetical protein LTS08_004530 [Lithohypha guttulata]|nr:hypothetical protein LTS08_004530 [Lithohypha guttulata]